MCGKIVNEHHVDRLQKMIETSGGKVVHGGQVDREDKFVELTVILNPKIDSKLMTEEIFGPIIPIIPFSSIENAISMINS